jgi:hypothetical protein
MPVLATATHAPRATPTLRDPQASHHAKSAEQYTRALVTAIDGLRTPVTRLTTALTALTDALAALERDVTDPVALAHAYSAATQHAALAHRLSADVHRALACEHERRFALIALEARTAELRTLAEAGDQGVDVALAFAGRDA